MLRKLLSQAGVADAEAFSSHSLRRGFARWAGMLEFPRSTIYAQQARENAKVVPLHPARREPKPKIADADLLAAIRADLGASPFVGEGHRKVWARLRILHDIRVSKDRVCRLMRDNALLSPHRVSSLDRETIVWAWLGFERFIHALRTGGTKEPQLCRKL